MRMTFRAFLLLLFALCGPGSTFGQILSDAVAKGGGSYSTCDTSVVVDLEVTPLGDLFQQFTAIVDSGSNTTIIDHTWTYYSYDAIQQASGEEVQVMYAAPGGSPVCLTVSAFDLNDMEACQATKCSFVDIVQDPICLDYQPDFTIASVNGNTIGFEEIIQTSGDFWVQWSFGDGSVSLGQLPEYSFSGPGPHEICLTITGPEPTYCVGRVCKWLYLGPGEVPCSEVLEPGFLHFQSENVVVVLDTSIFSGQSGTVHWDFGDGTTAEGQVAVHVYEPWAAGYEICSSIDLWGPLVSDTCESTQCKFIEIGAAVSIGDEIVLPEIRSWPNPASDFISFTCPVAGPGEVFIRDAIGRIVATHVIVASSTEILIPVAELAPGLYHLQFRQGQTVHVGQFVKE